MIELAIAVSFAICISAGCSLFEAVLYSVPASRIEAMIHAGKASGRIFKEIRGNVERPIAAILSLNTIANTAGAAFAGWAAAEVFGNHFLVYFSVFFTMAVLVFSEIIPKTIGVIYGGYMVPLVAYPLKGLVYIMMPAIWLSSLVTRLIARGKTEDAISAEEIRGMARLSLRAGGIRPYQERVIEGILGLHNKSVKDVMTPRTVIFSLSEHLTLEQAGLEPNIREHSRFPVYDRDIEDVVGVVYAKELFIALSEGNKQMPLTELMWPVNFAAETAHLNDILTDFLESRQHLFVALDEYGGLTGLITLEDVLEEILGREIVDESDKVIDKRELARRRRKHLMNTI
ncbi:MAG: HlyC/CorC family transporter [Desulfobacterales bacterium]|nr:HlyC/CorC family transporter [Desulfobacterales bacterium]